MVVVVTQNVDTLHQSFIKTIRTFNLINNNILLCNKKGISCHLKIY